MELTNFKATEGECDKCSKGGAGPFQIKGECASEVYSCKGVKVTKETKDCVKYCPESGAGRLNPSVVFVHGICGPVT